jgi:hypothetical protein
VEKGLMELGVRGGFEMIDMFLILVLAVTTQVYACGENLQWVYVVIYRYISRTGQVKAVSQTGVFC